MTEDRKRAAATETPEAPTRVPDLRGRLVAAPRRHQSGRSSGSRQWAGIGRAVDRHCGKRRWTFRERGSPDDFPAAMKLNSAMPSAMRGQREDIVPGVAGLRLMLLAVLLVVQINAILGVAMPPGRLTASLAAVTALTALRAAHAMRRARWSLRLRLSVLAAEGLATYLPLLAMGAAWPGMGGFLAASMLLVASGWVAWALFTAVVLSMFPAAITLGLSVSNAGNITVVSLAVGLTIFGVCRLTSAIKCVRDTHTELAQLALIKERLRFARDLHDLLGYSLAAITLRAELTRRLMSSDPASASDELRDVVDIARQAGAEIRQVANGYRNISLAQEMAAATSLLASANVAAHVEMNCGVLPDKIDNVLAMVLRELITNVLRHSSARNCWISAEHVDEHVTLSVVNDGVPRAAATHRDGRGLENLTCRLEAVGGTLSAAVRGDGRFRVHTLVPIPGEMSVGGRQHRTGRTWS
jgi:two-component system sensor histidine kinase DesK